MSRRSGLLLHLTSLPGPFGLGDLGPAAYRFVDFLERAGQRVWQVLPLVPGGYGGSPYASPSTFAGNPLLISPELLVQDGLLEAADLDGHPDFPSHRADLEGGRRVRMALLQKAYARLLTGDVPDEVGARAFTAWSAGHADWLPTYALFAAIKADLGHIGLSDWPTALRLRDPQALADAAARLQPEVEMRRYAQFLFDRQWKRLRTYAAERDVAFLGDLPIYVAADSAEVWANPDLFDLDADGHPNAVSGVPPDYFSATGQLWGNPLYRWDVMEARGFPWWKRRLARHFEMFDEVRLDHFRGFEAYWAVPAGETTAIKGEWRPAPGIALFEAMEAEFGHPLPVVAEDLGLVTPAVTALIERFDLPGMTVLEFAFGGGAHNTFLPHRHKRRQVCYTGTHDNDTVVGWWRTAPEREREHALQYLGLHHSHEPLHWAFIRTALASLADLAVVPLQDALGLGSEARMNTPGTVGPENWSWRVSEGLLNEHVEGHLRYLTGLYGRLPVPPADAAAVLAGVDLAMQKNEPAAAVADAVASAAV